MASGINRLFQVRARECAHARFDHMYFTLREKCPDLARGDAFDLIIQAAEEAVRSGCVTVEATDEPIVVIRKTARLSKEGEAA